jgi:hypothetical protein
MTQIHPGPLVLHPGGHDDATAQPETLSVALRMKQSMYDNSVRAALFAEEKTALIASRA